MKHLAVASRAKRGPVLVIGGGVTGQRAALDLVHSGLEVLLIEKHTSLGGTVSQLGTMFPLHNCLLCRGEAIHGAGCTRPTISADLLDRSRPEGLSVWTQSKVVAVEGGPSGYRVSVRREPRYVDPARCISCDRCAEVCPHTMADQFQAGLTERKAAHKPSLRAVPDSYVIDKGPWCEGCGRCVPACPTAAISLEETPRTETVTVSAIVMASGMRLSDPGLSQEYGYGRYANVFTALEMERMTSPAGPGEGRIARRSDGRPPERIAWLQCVGSRDKSRDYCSAFCCGYATRQAVLARQILPSAQARIYMMDDRAFGKAFSATYDPLRLAYDVRLERCRLSVLREDPTTRDLLLQVAGENGQITEERFGLVVLSLGAEAAEEAAELASNLGIKTDAFGFVRTETLAPVDTPRPGIFVAGTAAGPADIHDSVTQGSAAAARVCSYLRHRPGRQNPSGAADRPAAAPVEKERRVGVFACDCAGEIGGVVDLARSMASASALSAVALSRIIPFGCLPDGLETIQSLIREHALTDVVMGACNRRTFAPLFERSLGVRMQFVSLREECAYVHRADPPGATRKAQALIRLAVDRLRRAERTPASPAGAPSREALVVGGGLAGVTAALHLAGAGIAVHIVEREARLGGSALRLNRTPEGKDVPAEFEILAARLRSHPRVTIHTSCEVTRHTGHQGLFTAALRSLGAPPRDTLLEVGATIVATGAEEYRGPAYGLGASKRVLTLLDFGQRLKKEPGMPAQLSQVAFIGCVGPWDEPGSSQSWRCSRNCCEMMMRQARAIKEANPACTVAVMVREVNTYAFREEEYTAARRSGVLFVRFGPAQPPRLEGSKGGPRLTVHDMSLQETLSFQPDLVVLSAAIVPRSDAQRVAFELGTALGVDGFLREGESKTRGFASLEPGIFACGLAHGPKPMREVIAQALAAAQHVLILLSQERIAASSVVARVETKRCALCLTCVRVCPYGVPRIEDELAAPGRTRRKSFIDPARCQGCGTCAPECPGKAIQLDHYGEETLLESGILGRWMAAS